MKTYAQLRDLTKSQFLAHQDSFWERLKEPDPRVREAHQLLRDHFDDWHAAILNGLAKHGPFDTSFNYACHAWTGEICIVPDASCEHGYRLACDWHIDQWALIEGVLAAVVGIAVTILCPPLALFAGFIGTIFVGIVLLALANIAAEFVTGACGASPEEHSEYLNRLAAEAVAA